MQRLAFTGQNQLLLILQQCGMLQVHATLLHVSCIASSNLCCNIWFGFHSKIIWSGVLAEAKGLHNEALRAFQNALEVQPTHVPSLVSAAKVLMNLGNQTSPVVRSFLTEALRIDRTNHEAWFNLGLVYKAEGGKKSVMEAADCFQAAAILEDSSPVEPFRWHFTRA